MPRKRRPALLGYCGKCGKNVEVDFCDHCQRYVQPSPNDEKESESTTPPERGAERGGR